MRKFLCWIGCHQWLGRGEVLMDNGEWRYGWLCVECGKDRLTKRRR